VADLGKGPGGRPPPPPTPSPSLCVKKEEMTEGRKAGRVSKTKPGPFLSSRYGLATGEEKVQRLSACLCLLKVGVHLNLIENFRKFKEGLKGGKKVMEHCVSTNF